MMKDRTYIYKVIAHQRMERAKRTFRIYQVLKLIRREFLIETAQEDRANDKPVCDDLLKHIVEAFVLCGNPEDGETEHAKVCPLIRNDQIFSLIRFCGGSTCLTKEECFILMKKIHVVQKRAILRNARGGGNVDNLSSADYQKLNNALNHIQIHSLVKAVEMVINDSMLDPYLVVNKLLNLFFANVQRVSLDDFKTFMYRFESYFNKDDLRFFLREVEQLERSDGLIDLSEIAALVRNDIESMPR